MTKTFLIRLSEKQAQLLSEAALEFLLANYEHDDVEEVDRLAGMLASLKENAENDFTA
jgi:hypothetical protein